MRREIEKVDKFMSVYQETRQETHSTNEQAYIVAEEKIGREVGKHFYRNYNSFRVQRTRYLRRFRRLK